MYLPIKSVLFGSVIGSLNLIFGLPPLVHIRSANYFKYIQVITTRLRG